MLTNVCSAAGSSLLARNSAAKLRPGGVGEQAHQAIQPEPGVAFDLRPGCAPLSARDHRRFLALADQGFAMWALAAGLIRPIAPVRVLRPGRYARLVDSEPC